MPSFIGIGIFVSRTWTGSDKVKQDQDVTVSAAGGVGASEESVAEHLRRLGFDEDMLGVLDPVVSATRLVQYGHGDAVYHEGDGIECLYLVRRGMVKLTNYLDNGRARIVRLHNRDSVIGLNGLLGEAHEHTAHALHDSEIYHLPLEYLLSLKEQAPLVYSRFSELWHSYLGYADTWITDFSTGPIKGRVARLVRFLAEIEEDTGPREVCLLTCEEMGDILGVTPESVSRVLAGFKRDGVLEDAGRGSEECYLCNLQALSREARD